MSWCTVLGLLVVELPLLLRGLEFRVAYPLAIALLGAWSVIGGLLALYFDRRE